MRGRSTTRSRREPLLEYVVATVLRVCVAERRPSDCLIRVTHITPMEAVDEKDYRSCFAVRVRAERICVRSADRSGAASFA